MFKGHAIGKCRHTLFDSFIFCWRESAAWLHVFGLNDPVGGLGCVWVLCDDELPETLKDRLSATLFLRIEKG